MLEVIADFSIQGFDGPKRKQGMCVSMTLRLHPLLALRAM
jgi:hypothetical protein